MCSNGLLQRTTWVDCVCGTVEKFCWAIFVDVAAELGFFQEDHEAAALQTHAWHSNKRPI